MRRSFDCVKFYKFQNFLSFLYFVLYLYHQTGFKEGFVRSKSYDRAMFRITTTLSELMTGEIISVRELSEQFNVSVRTVNYH